MQVKFICNRPTLKLSRIKVGNCFMLRPAGDMVYIRIDIDRAAINYSGNHILAVSLNSGIVYSFKSDKDVQPVDTTLMVGKV
jgi:hypothetical protein